MLEFADSDAKLHGVDSGIGHRESGIGNMDVLEGQSRVISVTWKRKMNSDSRLGSEIYAVCARGNIVIRDQNPAAEFNEWHNMGGIAPKVVLKIEGCEADSVCTLARLRHDEYGNELEFVLERPATEFQKAKPITRPGIEDAGIAGSAANAVSSLRKELEFTSSVANFLPEKMTG